MSRIQWKIGQKSCHTSHPQSKVSTCPTTRGKSAHVSPPEESQHMSHHQRKVSTHLTPRVKLAHVPPPEESQHMSHHQRKVSTRPTTRVKVNITAGLRQTPLCGIFEVRFTDTNATLTITIALCYSTKEGLRTYVDTNYLKQIPKWLNQMYYNQRNNNTFPVSYCLRRFHHQRGQWLP